MSNVQIYKGRITYSKTVIYQGNKKRFTGYIQIQDEYGNLNSYKMVSFRSQVINQSDTLGENGMKNMNCLAHGTFKLNEWNGQSNYELMVEKIILEGMEHLSEQAQTQQQSMPSVPHGSLPIIGQPIESAYGQPQSYNEPNIPQPQTPVNGPASGPAAGTGFKISDIGNAGNIENQINGPAAGTGFKISDIENQTSPQPELSQPILPEKDLIQQVANLPKF